MYVSELCLGTMTFGGQGFWKVMGGLGQESVTSLVKQAFDAGVNFIDIADIYAKGEAERVVGRAIEGYMRSDLVMYYLAAPAIVVLGPVGPLRENLDWYVARLRENTLG